MNPTATEDRIRCEAEFAAWGREQIAHWEAWALKEIDGPHLHPLQIPHELSNRLREACALAGKACLYERDSVENPFGTLMIL